MPFLDAARGLPLGITLREELDADRAFVAALYASTREEELRPVDWPEERKRAFLQEQFDLQWTHYRRHYPRAEWLLLERAGTPVGRMYLEVTDAEARLMDIALTAPERNRGVGTAIMHSLLNYTNNLGLPVTLHVEPFNPALRLYQRLGFTASEMRGIYLFMQRPPLPL